VLDASSISHSLFCVHLSFLHYTDDVGEEPVDSDEEEEEEEEESDDEGELDEDDDEEEEEEFEGSTPSKAEKASSKSSRANTPPPPKLDARAKFASNLLLLNGVQLGHVISMLEKQCPAALESDCQQLPDKLEIVIDKIEPASLFHSIAQYAADKASKTKRGMNVAASPKIVDVSNKRSRK